MGFIKPSSGDIKVLGESPRNPKIKRLIGYLPENPYYYDHLSAEELLRFSARTSGIADKDIDGRIDRILQTMSLKHARKRKLRSYSKGMTQRAGICFAIIHDPQLLILDEPMSGLDPIGRKDVVELVLDLKKSGKTILFCSHILNDVQKLCDRMAIMNKGRILKVMTGEKLRSNVQQITLACGELPLSVSENLIRLGANIRKVEKINFVDSPKKDFNNILNELKKNDIGIDNIQTSEDALEKFFFETIQDETRQ